jgi:hypothetical protein
MDVNCSQLTTKCVQKQLGEQMLQQVVQQNYGCTMPVGAEPAQL